MTPKLTIVFFLALACAIMGPILLPGIRLLAFGPFLAILCTRLNLLKCLWCAFGCGLAMDLLSSSLPFGCHALNYILVTLVLFRTRKFFFAHKPVALALLTALFSLFSTGLHFIMLGCAVHFGVRGVLSDFVIMPICDGIYAFVGYTCPIYAYRNLRKFIKRIRIRLNGHAY